MKLLCVLFGHKTPQHRSEFTRMGGGDYLVTKGKPYVDNIDRHHYTLMGICPRCGEDYVVGKIHGHRISFVVNDTQEALERRISVLERELEKFQ